MLTKLLCSSVSMRRAALILNIHRTTVKRKLEFLSLQARLRQRKWLKTKSFSEIQFDDLETIEHTKCKPLTVTLCVENKSRKIISYCVSKIGAKGPLAKNSIRKYGKRENTSFKNREFLFEELKSCVKKDAQFYSDDNPFYLSPLKKHFPQAKHLRFKGKKACVTGQGELKALGYDPLFSINHTLAMLRANINRLVRRSWCTTKKPHFLDKHIAIYVDFHNQNLTS